MIGAEPCQTPIGRAAAGALHGVIWRLKRRVAAPPSLYGAALIGISNPLTSWAGGRIGARAVRICQRHVRPWYHAQRSTHAACATASSPSTTPCLTSPRPRPHARRELQVSAECRRAVVARTQPVVLRVFDLPF